MGPPLAAAYHFGGALGGALFHAVPQVEKTAACPARRRHGAGGERGQRCPNLLLLLLLPVQLHSMLPLLWVQVGDSILQSVELLLPPRLGWVRSQGLGSQSLPGGPGTHVSSPEEGGGHREGPGAAVWLVASVRLLAAAPPAPQETQRHTRPCCTVLSCHPINRLQADGATRGRRRGFRHE